MDSEYNVLAAHVTGAHGVGGNVRLRLVGQHPEASVRSLEASPMIRLIAPDGQATQDARLSSLRRQPGPKGAWVGRFKDIKDRNAAEALQGWGVYVTEANRAALPDGEYYVDQLLGMDVATDTGRDLGKLADVIHSPAHDVYETDRGVLVPAVAAFVQSVDLERRVITVHDMPGLGDDAP